MKVKFNFDSAFNAHGFLFNEESGEFSYYIDDYKNQVKLNPKVSQTLSRSLFLLISQWEQNTLSSLAVDESSASVEIEFNGEKQKKSFKNNFPENFDQIYSVISEVAGVSLR